MPSLTKIRYPIVESINPSQINAGGATNGQLLGYDESSGHWIPKTVTVSPSSITSGGASNGQVMTWNGTSWVPVTPGNVTSALNGGSLIGSVAYFAMSTAPQGWLVCDGRQLNRTDFNSMYNALFLQIGYTYGGAGDLFNLPDLRGEFIRGWSNGRTGVDTGRTFGSSQTDELKAHSHNITAKGTLQSGGDEIPPLDSTGNLSQYSTSATGGTETRPRNVALLPCICYASMFNGIPVGPASGDLSSNYPSPTVVGLRGRSILDTSPSDGQVLTFSSTSNAWVAKNGNNYTTVGNASAGIFAAAVCYIPSSPGTGTWTAPAGCYTARVTVVGGGASYTQRTGGRSHFNYPSGNTTGPNQLFAEGGGYNSRGGSAGWNGANNIAIGGIQGGGGWPANGGSGGCANGGYGGGGGAGGFNGGSGGSYGRAGRRSTTGAGGHATAGGGGGSGGIGGNGGPGGEAPSSFNDTKGSGGSGGGSPTLSYAATMLPNLSAALAQYAGVGAGAIDSEGFGGGGWCSAIVSVTPGQSYSYGVGGASGIWVGYGMVVIEW